MQPAHPDADDHDRGLVYDLEVMARRIERRRALAWVGGAGLTALLAGCGGGSGSSDDTGPSATSASSSSSSSSGSTSSSTGSSSGGSTSTSGSCIADASETAGPYPADGTNTASGATSDVLTQSGIVRSDIRSSFISSTTTAAGVLVTITLTVVGTSNSCAALSGYAVYLWHADADGEYSLYSAPTESYLRGVQITDANGQVTFTTIFPGCYDGRYPHMHFEVFTSQSVATSGRNAALTSQLAMPAAACQAVYADTAGYPSSAANYAKVSVGSDNVFGDNTSAQIAQMTPTFTGSTSAGYTATATIGL